MTLIIQFPLPSIVTHFDFSRIYKNISYDFETFISLDRSEHDRYKSVLSNLPSMCPVSLQPHLLYLRFNSRSDIRNYEICFNSVSILSPTYVEAANWIFLLNTVVRTFTFYCSSEGILLKLASYSWGSQHLASFVKIL